LFDYCFVKLHYLVNFNKEKDLKIDEDVTLIYLISKEDTKKKFFLKKIKITDELQEKQLKSIDGLEIKAPNLVEYIYFDSDKKYFYGFFFFCMCIDFFSFY
jgi:hypothetical protein